MSIPKSTEKGTAQRTAQGWSVLDLNFLRNPRPSIVGLGVCIGAILGLAIACTTSFVLVQFLWQAVTLPTEGFEDTSKRLLALGVVVAAPFAIWRIIVSHWQARAAQAQARAATHQAEVAREEHYTSLFTAAVGQLGAMREVSNGTRTWTEPNVEARLGAIYALERIAQDSERDHWPIMETLCAYVRNAAGPAQTPSAEIKEAVIEHYESGDSYEPIPRVDVQAALTVIGRRKNDRLRHEGELRSTALGAQSYRLDLRGTNLAKVVLDGLQFDHAAFDKSDLSFASLQKTSLISASLDGVSAVGANFSSAKMQDTKLSGHWQGANLRFAKLSNLRGFYFTTLNVDGASFASADLSGSRLFRWSMVKASLPKANLKGTHLYHCLLVGTSFNGADLSTAKFDTETWDTVSLVGANLLTANGLDQGNVDASFGDAETSLPVGLSRPASWLSIDGSKAQAQEYQMEFIKHRRRAVNEWREAEKKKALDDDIPF